MFQKYLIVFLLSILTLKSAAFDFSLRKTNNDSLKKPVRYFAYSPGIYAPFGLMVGEIWPKGNGFYISGRFNYHVFKKASYHFEGNSLNDHSLSWIYDGVKVYSRLEINAGGIVKLYKKENRWGLKICAGAGILRPRYLYSFSKIGTGISNQTWVENTDIAKTSLNTEVSTVFWMGNRLTFQIGMSGINKKHERMMIFGFGVGLL